MLNEESIVLLVTLGACALLALGILELIWPTRPRQARYRPPGAARPAAISIAPPSRAPADASAADRDQEAEPDVPAFFSATPAAPPVATQETGPDSPRTDPARSSSRRSRTDRGVARASLPRPPASPDRRIADEGARAAPAGPEASAAALSALEICQGLYEKRRFADVVSMGVAALSVERVDALGASEAAQLWSLVAHARQALDDYDGAEAALQSAITVASDEDRDTYRRELAAFVVGAGGTFLERSREARDDAERVAALRKARALLKRGRDTAAGDAALDVVLGAINEAYWPASERAITKLIADEEFDEAHRLARNALADSDFPADRSGAFETLRTEALGAQIAQRAGDALSSMEMGRDWDAIASLERADALLTSATGHLSVERREDIERRLWWAYTRLGTRGVEAGEFEGALDPLFRALRFSSIDPARRDETCVAMVKALDGVAKNRSTMIREVASLGNRESALIQAEKLWSLLQNGVSAGVTEAAIAEAVETTRRLFAELGRTLE